MARRVYVSESKVAAPIERVWETLVDLESYPRWNPFTVSVRSNLEVGAPVRMRVKMAKLGITVRQREVVREIEAPRRLVWGARMLGVRAERVQTLAEVTGGTRYRTEDVIEGPLAPLVFRIFGASIQVGFEGVAEALTREVLRREDLRREDLRREELQREELRGDGEDRDDLP